MGWGWEYRDFDNPAIQQTANTTLDNQAPDAFKAPGTGVASADPVAAVAASSTCLVVARSSGVVYRYRYLMLVVGVQVFIHQAPKIKPTNSQPTPSPATTCPPPSSPIQQPSCLGPGRSAPAALPSPPPRSQLRQHQGRRGGIWGQLLTAGYAGPRCSVIAIRIKRRWREHRERQDAASAWSWQGGRGAGWWIGGVNGGREQASYYRGACDP